MVPTGMGFETAERDLQMIAFTSHREGRARSVPSYLRAQAAKPRTAIRPKLAWMRPAGWGSRGGPKGKIRVTLELEIIPSEPVHRADLGVTFGDAPPGSPVRVPRD